MLFLFFVLLSMSVLAVRADDECQPVTWPDRPASKRDVNANYRRSNGTTTLPQLGDLVVRNVTVGEVNCRDSTFTKDDVNYYTCTELAKKYQITNDVFFALNPTILPDCSNILPNTEYCVGGFIEPLRSTDGLCGPRNNNATCLGTDAQCCNAETWTCGDTPEDCAAGTCYEGACYGDTIYSTDGTCGYQHGNRRCAGKWGDCCNMEGKCGTGEAFCAQGACQIGNCTRPPVAPSLPDYMRGNTTDGTCGGPNKFTCNVLYGFCCNKDGKCGSLASDCGEGCQPEWGTCCGANSDSSCSSSTVRSSTKSSTTSSTTSSSSTSTTSRATSASSSTQSTKTSSSTRSATATTTAFTALPTCGQTCINNMLAQYSELGCASPDPACLCQNVNFGYGIRDCANGACGTSVGSTVIAYGSAYCSTALATALPTTPTTPTPTTTATGITSLPSCGQLCFNNMQAQHSELGCATVDAYCLCQNVNFGYGLRDCANGACGTAVGSTVIAFGSAYCASASATATAKP